MSEANRALTILAIWNITTMGWRREKEWKMLGRSRD